MRLPRSTRNGIALNGANRDPYYAARVALPGLSVLNPNGFPAGVRGSAVARDEKSGRLQSAALAAIPMAQSDRDIVTERLDIQRVQSAVLVEIDGNEYAIVADDNDNFLDPYYAAQFETPHFVFTPSGPPIATGGSASARKVAVGGKLGIVKDPFGLKGTPQYLGATLPLDGYGIQNLSLSPDHKVLLGQLSGKFSARDMWLQSLPNQSGAWDVRKLIAAANAQKEQGGLKKHIKLPTGAEQLISTGTAAPAGTFFDDDSINIQVQGNMGDVLEIDTKRLVAHAILGLPMPSEKLTAEEAANIKAHEAEIKILIENLEITFTKPEIEKITEKSQFLLVKDGNSPYSRTNIDGAGKKAEFGDTGRFYVVPNLVKSDLENLRAGKQVDGKFMQVNPSYKLNREIGRLGDHSIDPEAYEGRANLTISAFDYEKRSAVFFGDRPLDNPGYSSIELLGSIQYDKENDELDVYRVEQRLAYLGFGGRGSGRPTPNDNNTQNVNVNGKLEMKDAYALWAFNRTVNFYRADESAPAIAKNSWQVIDRIKKDEAVLGKDGKQQKDKNGNPITKKVLDKETTFANLANVVKGYKLTDTAAAGETADWLSAYNAPHWMQLFPSTSPDSKVKSKFKVKNPNLLGWYTNQEGVAENDSEVFGTSWMYDSMAAKQFAGKEFSDAVGVSGSRMTGSADANLGFTLAAHSTHDLGMAMDLSVFYYIDSKHQAKNDNDIAADIQAADEKYLALKGKWDNAKAIALAAELKKLDEGTEINVNDQYGALLDFLSLYAVTQKENGSRGEVEKQFVNAKDKVKAADALFGSSGPANSIILKGYIGQKGKNEYTAINSILDRLGFDFRPEIPHADHFHIALQPPKLVKIESPKKITADGHQAVDKQDNTAVSTSHTYLSQFITAAQTESRGTTQSLVKLAVCSAIDSHTPDGGGSHVGPTSAVGIYRRDRGWGKDAFVFSSETRIRVLVEPTHGTLKIGRRSDGADGYYYLSSDPYRNGLDRIVFELIDKGVTYIIDDKILHLHAVESYSEEEKSNFAGELCDGKVRQAFNGRPGLVEANYSTSVLSYNLHMVFRDLSTLAIQLADLNGNVAAQVNDDGISAAISLSNTAAGHGWYLDPTPLDNTDDFLPTADPTIWRAKAGGAADGTMDMHSVLLHEYGHVLGLDHIPDGGDFMGATLQPGERRLPTAEELVWMAQRAAELKAEKEASTHTSEGSGGTDESPAHPNRLQPAYPAWGTLGTSTRLSRRSPNRSAGGDMGGTARLPDAGTALATATPTAPQLATAVNATLTNGNFGASGTPNGAGWMAQGDVRFTADGAVLGEAGTRQARLLQCFALGADDKFHSFTVAGRGLAANEAGPNDAFEVALLNADSGQSLAGNLTLQGTDALLNRQGDGGIAPERFAGTLTRTANDDGSAAYLVAVPAGLAGKAALFSVDLLGFAAAKSAVPSLRQRGRASPAEPYRRSCLPPGPSQ